MESSMALKLGDETVRFTHDGRIFLLDAIRLMCSCDISSFIWEKIKTEHPDVVEYFEDCGTGSGKAVPVTDTKGLEKIWMLLFGYISDPDLV